MPSGAKKRKAAKKKKVNNSSTTNPHQGENDGGELNIQDPLIENENENEGVEVEKREDNPSENKAKDVNEEEGNVEIEIGSKSKSSNGSSSSSSDSSDDESRVVEKNVVVLESVPVIESLPEKTPIEYSVKPVDDLLLESVTKVYDETKSEVKKELVVEETPVIVEEQTVVVSKIDSKDDCPTSSVVVESVSREHGVVELPLVDEKTSAELKDRVESSTPLKDSISEVVNGVDCANEIDRIEHSDRQAPVASPPLTVQKTTSWKGCCGLFELFSGSAR